MTGRFASFLVLLVSCFAAAVLGLGGSYDGFVTPLSSRGELVKIAGDGWIEDGARLEYTGLLSRANHLDLLFDPWRPSSAPPAEIEVSVCGVHATSWTISAPGPHRVYLSGTCDPRVVSMHVLNPVSAGKSDGRALGARMKTATVSSKAGFPLVAFRSMLAYTWLLLVVILPWVLSLGRIWAGPVLAAAFAILLTRCDFADLNQFHSVCLIAGVVGWGLFAGSSRRVFLTAISEPRAWWPSAAVVAILLFGAAIRFHGLEFGLPFNFHPDEVPKVNAIERMYNSGSLDPNYFLHPSLLLYLTYATNLMLQTGVGKAIVSGLFSVEGGFRETGFLAGRIVSATAGTLSLGLVFLLGRRLFSAKSAIAAAAFLAVLPLHVTCSRYLKEDALLTFVSLVYFYSLVRSLQTGSVRWLLFAGFAAGMTFSTKYTGLLVSAPLFVVPWLRSWSVKPDRTFLRWWLPALMLIPVGFLVCTPYAFFNSERFINDFQQERHHMETGHSQVIDAWSQLWMYHFSYSIIPGSSLLGTIVALFGVGLLIRRGRREDLFVVLTLLLFYLPAEFVKAKPAPQPERYILPCLPFLALAAGEVIRLLASTRARFVAPVLAAAMIIVPFTRTVRITSEIRTDTRTELASWMKANLPKDSKVLLEWKPYGPALTPDDFELMYIPRAKVITSLNPRSLKSTGADYLVISSLFYDRFLTQPGAFPLFRQRIRELFTELPIVRKVSAKHGTYGFHNPTLVLFSLKDGTGAAADTDSNRASMAPKIEVESSAEADVSVEE